MSSGYYPKRTALYLDDLMHGLITASHILHHHHLLDAYGHISVRNPDDPASFFLPSNMAPALLSSADDIVLYRVEDAGAVEADEKRDGYIERWIHSEIYKRFAGVNAVVHSHCGDVLPFSVVGNVQLRPCLHMAGFLGAGVPVWDIASSYSSSTFGAGSGSSQPHDLLVRDSKLGHSFAAAFAKPASSASFIYAKMKSALPATLAGGGGAGSVGAATTHEATDALPAHPVVLMRGHGFTTTAAGIEDAVFQAVYTAEAARAQSAALTLSLASSLGSGGTVEGKVDVESGGKIRGGKVRFGDDAEAGVKVLSEREAADAWEMNRLTVQRPWKLWCREVEVNPLYANEVKREGDGKELEESWKGRFRKYMGDRGFDGTPYRVGL